jgi:hypothetical protein
MLTGASAAFLVLFGQGRNFEYELRRYDRTPSFGKSLRVLRLAAECRFMSKHCGRARLSSTSWSPRTGRLDELFAMGLRLPKHDRCVTK